MEFTPFGETPLNIYINAETDTITLVGDLNDSYNARRTLSTTLAEAPRKARWTIDADGVRFDERGLATWTEYVNLVLQDANLRYAPSQFATTLFFDRGIIYTHEKSEFEGV